MIEYNIKLKCDEREAKMIVGASDLAHALWGLDVFFRKLGDSPIADDDSDVLLDHILDNFYEYYNNVRHYIED